MLENTSQHIQLDKSTSTCDFGLGQSGFLRDLNFCRLQGVVFLSFSCDPKPST